MLCADREMYAAELLIFSKIEKNKILQKWNFKEKKIFKAP